MLQYIDSEESEKYRADGAKLISADAGAALRGKPVSDAKRSGKNEYKQASLF